MNIRKKQQIFRRIIYNKKLFAERFQSNHWNQQSLSWKNIAYNINTDTAWIKKWLLDKFLEFSYW